MQDDVASNHNLASVRSFKILYAVTQYLRHIIISINFQIPFHCPKLFKSVCVCVCIKRRLLLQGVLGMCSFRCINSERRILSFSWTPGASGAAQTECQYTRETSAAQFNVFMECVLWYHMCLLQKVVSKIDPVMNLEEGYGVNQATL